MVSLRLQVLDFVHDYIGEWRVSPSLGEIAAAVSSNRVRVLRAVDNLAASGLLVKRPGARGLALPNQCDEAVRLLEDMGMRVDDPRNLARAASPHRARRVTNRQLLTMPPLDYIQTPKREDDHGRQKQANKQTQD